MNPKINPYAPGAGTVPPELAGRDFLIEEASTSLYRIARGLSARSHILYGLRGVGKTVLLNRILLEAEADKAICAMIEVPENRTLPAILAPNLRATLIKMSRGQQMKSKARKAMQALASFVKGAKIKYSDVEFSFDMEPLLGVADSGDTSLDMIDLMVEVGHAAREHETVVVLFLDELQYVEEKQLADLITALHKCSQLQLPVTMMAAGLPQLLGQLGNAKSYAERLFQFTRIGALDDTSAMQALTVPAEVLGVEYTPEALDAILQETENYPYFLQQWGRYAWNSAEDSPIQLRAVEAASAAALAELDASFFRVRFDRLTPLEKRYLRAMAELGEGPYRSGDVATILERTVQSCAPTRASLIRKGMVYSISHGDNAFTVPLFGGFIKRIMPDVV